MKRSTNRSITQLKRNTEGSVWEVFASMNYDSFFKNAATCSNEEIPTVGII
jgi:hypothetical protein